jgi:hypothetical protein
MTMKEFKSIQEKLNNLYNIQKTNYNISEEEYEIIAKSLDISIDYLKMEF